jgi:cell wall-associated NlpC family hydrolase
MALPRTARRLLVGLAIIPGLLFPPLPAHADGGGQEWADVAANHWARTAIDFVAHKNTWMQDYGPSRFKPNALEARKYLAHAMVLAFAPNEPIDPLIQFDDMAVTDPFYRYANVSVKLRWFRQTANFLPEQPVTMTDVHKALVHAVGLWNVAQGVDRIHTTNGYRFKHQRNLGALEIGMHLGLRYNHDDESLDVRPAQQLPRSEVAWSLYRAYTATTKESWRIGALSSGGFANIHLGPVSPELRKVVEFGLRYVGYPYIYAGEWYQPTPAGYCCGTQPQGGFDCSGFTWWLMKAPSGTYDNSKLRGYQGWDLPQRSSSEMASVGAELSFKDARAGDLMFYDGDDDGTIDHVDVYLGYGWAIDSSSGIGGVTVLRVDTGWYRDHFVHARHIVKT